MDLEYLKEHNKSYYDEESIEYKIIQTKELSDEEKKLKKEIKTMEEKLHLLTKETIENLSESDIKELLKKKWIDPVLVGFESIYENVINTFISKIKAIEEKYSETLEDIESEINSVEKDLIFYIDKLTGNESDMKGLEEFKKIIGGV